MSREHALELVGCASTWPVGTDQQARAHGGDVALEPAAQRVVSTARVPAQAVSHFEDEALGDQAGSHLVRSLSTDARQLVDDADGSGEVRACQIGEERLVTSGADPAVFRRDAGRAMAFDVNVDIIAQVQVAVAGEVHVVDRAFGETSRGFTGDDGRHHDGRVGRGLQRGRSDRGEAYALVLDPEGGSAGPTS